MKRIIALGLGACLWCAIPALAQSIETVVVTASPPRPVGQATFSTVTLDQGELQTFNQLDASLEQVPGLSLFRRSTSLNANPTIQGVSLRAIAPSGAGRTLVLLDGVPVNDPFGGWVIWASLPPEDIGSAAVVRGAGAGPYGAGALTGTITLDERSDTEGVSTADASAGELGTYRVAASGGTSLGDLSLFGSVAGERSDGWIPVDQAQRGAADNHLWLDSGAASLRGDEMVGNTLVSGRIGVYDVAQGAGLVGAEAKAKGITGSLTLATSAGPAGPGWRVQIWAERSDFSNTSVATAPDRSVTTPANDQYSTPALGIGGNVALIGAAGNFRWEAGGDVRMDSGESRERFLFIAPDFQNNRRSGGTMTVGGLYVEGAYDASGWLLTAGLRGDAWSTAQGHLDISSIASGAPISQTHFDGRSGIVPTGRAGIRHDFADGEYLRAAAYSGFRAPTLNELYRPFRVGNNVTNQNPDLKPERLYGAEIGWGGDIPWLSWNADVFWNRLHDAVANVTIGTVTCGTPPVACGILYQRQNIPDIEAVGFEADAEHHLSDVLALRAAVSLTDARVHDPGDALNGKRPAQAPLATVTGGAVWRPLDPLTLAANLRWESSRFEDDLNTLRLGSALTVDARADWRFTPAWSAFIAVDNLLDADVATQESVFGVFSYGAPRVISIGLTYAP